MHCNHCFGTRRLWDAMLEEHSVGQRAEVALARSAAADAAMAAADLSPFHGWAEARDAASSAWADHESAEADYEAASKRVRACQGALQRAGGCLYGD